jgi:hypothetical protein
MSIQASEAEEGRDNDRREAEDLTALVPDERTSKRRHMALVTST